MDSGNSLSGYHRFLRFGHILGSSLREILEDRFLGEMSEYRLNRAQFCSLKLIALNANLNVGELARCIGTSSAACTKNVDRLVDLGLVTRVVSTEDRRASLLAPSPSGLALVEEYEDLKWRRVAPVIDQLGPEKAEQLCDLLEEVCLGLLKTDTALRIPCMRCSGYFDTDCSVAQLQGDCTLKIKRRARTRLGDGRLTAARRRTAGAKAIVKGSER